MPITPDQVEEYIIARHDLESMYTQIDMALKNSTYVGAVVEIDAPRLVGERVAQLYRAAGWNVGYECVDHGDSRAKSKFDLTKFEKSFSYMDR